MASTEEFIHVVAQIKQQGVPISKRQFELKISREVAEDLSVREAVHQRARRIADREFGPEAKRIVIWYAELNEQYDLINEVKWTYLD